MKRKHLIFLIFILPICLSGQLGVMSFNIRYDNAGDGPNAWKHRKLELVQFLDSLKPAIIGLQEALDHQLFYMDSALADYAFVGVGREDGQSKGEYAPIFYQKSRLELIFYHTHWLSESGDTGSVGWDAALPRILGVAKFKDRQTGKVLMVLNTHFDHQGRRALEGATLTSIGMIQQYQQQQPYVDGLIFLGDLNAEPETVQMRFLAGQLDDAFQKCQHGPFGPSGTYNAFDAAKSALRRIDYIYTQNFHIKEYRCIEMKLRNGQPISDHWPIWVSLEFDK